MINKRVKGGLFMNKNNRKFLAVGIACMFVFMLGLQVVSAEIILKDDGTWTTSEGKEASGVHGKLEDSAPKWLFSTVQFFKLGVTWADFIIAMAVILMVFAAAFDILGFTAFEKDWVKYSIAGAVAIVFGVTGGVGAFAVGIMKLAGGSIMIATGASIVVAAFFFFLGSFFKSKRKVFKAKTVAKEAEGGFEKSAAAVTGTAKLADAAAEAAE